MAFEDPVDRLPEWSKLVGVEARLGEHRGIDGRVQQRVALAQRQFEGFCETQDLLSTRPRTALLDPPQEIRDATSALGFPNPTLEARGYDALEVRTARAYEEFIAPGQFAFRSRDNASRIANVVTFNWEMVPTDGGPAVGAGRDVFVLDDDDRIRVDYQLIER